MSFIVLESQLVAVLERDGFIRFYLITKMCSSTLMCFGFYISRVLLILHHKSALQPVIHVYTCMGITALTNLCPIIISQGK